MAEHNIFTMAFSKVYTYYTKKAEKKGRTKAEVDDIIRWLTGYDQKSLALQIENEVDFRTFFDHAPQLNPNVDKIKGVICGCRVEDMEEGLMKNIRHLDKMIDELAKGKDIEKILRK